VMLAAHRLRMLSAFGCLDEPDERAETVTVSSWTARLGERSVFSLRAEAPILWRPMGDRAVIACNGQALIFSGDTELAIAMLRALEAAPAATFRTAELLANTGDEEEAFDLLATLAELGAFVVHAEDEAENEEQR
jgi:hypothetical protein